MSKKTFEELFTELQHKAAHGDPATSRTAELVGKGVHAISKKVVEEAAEVWMAAEHEGKEAAAEENELDPDVAAHEKEMGRIGADVKGEGEIG